MSSPTNKTAAEPSVDPTFNPPPAGDFLGHPRALWNLFGTEFWERFMYYGMRAMLAVHIASAFFAHLSGAEAREQASLTYGGFTALVYMTGIAGGFIADRILGYQRSIMLGGVLMAIGSFMLMAPDLTTFLVGLAVIVVGNGLFKPNISTMVGKLYAPGDARRDSGFTIFYMGINVGAFLSSLIVGYVGINYGWGYGFALSGLMMALGLVQFVLGKRHLLGQAEPPANHTAKAEGLIYAAGVLLTFVVWQVLQTKINLGPLSALAGGHEVTLTELVAVVLGAGLYIWFIRLLLSGISAAEKGRMVMLMVLITVSALFWGLYEQTYGPWLAMADRAMDLTTFGIRWNAAQTTAIGALAVISLSPVFAWIWPRLDKVGMNPSYPAKFAWGLVFCGLAFGVLAFAAANPSADTGLVSLWWMVLAYFVLVMGEMVLSPVGLSAVTSLSIPRAVGMMMGAWFLFSAFGEIIAGRLGTWAAVPHDASREMALATYADVFTSMMWIGLAAGVALFAATPLLKRLTRD